MDFREILFLACVGLFTGAAAVWDFRTRKLPNVLTVPAFAAGLLFHTVFGGLSYSQEGLLFALTGFAVGFGMLFLLWLVGGISGGDVKFMGALGCWLGTWLTVQAFVLGALLAGCIEGLTKMRTTFQMKRRKGNKTDSRPQRHRKTGADRLTSLRTARGRWQVAFGVWVAAATWFVLALQEAGLSWQPW
jgi:prepilin peptidase CpaA